MARENGTLVVGAGPAGLAAALFLRRQGRGVRIVEQRQRPSEESRALAVNPRTLEILEPTGITEQMLELGLPVRGVCFHRQGGAVETIGFGGIHPRYPFMLALSQASTERLLSRALARAGVEVERGVRLVECRNLQEGAEAVLQLPGGEVESARSAWLVAADGAHSTVRQQLKADFPGAALEGEWQLADVPLQTGLPPDHGHVFFFAGGRFLFMIRVVDEALAMQPGGELWRVISNRAEPLAQVTEAKQAGAPLWQSSFSVSHRMVTNMAVGNVYFAGDAAHLHSPIGARGMNLGIEDAWVLSELARNKLLPSYHAIRYRIDRQVVRRVELLTRMVAAQSPFSRLLRDFLLPAAVRTPGLRGRTLAAVTGLDHALPLFSGSALQPDEDE